MASQRGQTIQKRILKCYGLSEQHIAETLETFFKGLGDVKWDIYPHHPEYHIALDFQGSHEQIALKNLDEAEKSIQTLLDPYIVANGDKDLENTVGEMLIQRELTISVAESCTGGLIGNRLTNVPGSSGYFLGGIIAYSNASKSQLLKVSPKTLQNYGAVSNQTAQEMAEGVQKQFQSHLGLSITGIAGPDGGSLEKPVGTVHIGLATEDKVFAEKYCFKGTREQIKLESSEMALDWVRRYIKDDSFLPGV